MSERCGFVVALAAVVASLVTSAATGELTVRRRGPLDDQQAPAVVPVEEGQAETRQLMWSDFLYPAKDPESPLNFELDPFNATSELTASQQDDIIYDAQHPTPKPTEKSGWTKFWQIFF